MPRRGNVVFTCRKCGKTVTRPAAKTGRLFSCGTCRCVQKTPGIASQQQASGEQLALLVKAHRWHLRDLIGAACAIPLLFVSIFLAVLIQRLLGFDYPPLFETLWASTCIFFALTMIFLLFAEVISIESLGGSKGGSFLLFLLCWPAWLVRSATTFFRIRSALARLRSLGPRT